jgi:hypothetical protein
VVGAGAERKDEWDFVDRAASNHTTITTLGSSSRGVDAKVCRSLKEPYFQYSTAIARPSIRGRGGLFFPSPTITRQFSQSFLVLRVTHYLPARLKTPFNAGF